MYRIAEAHGLSRLSLDACQRWLATSKTVSLRHIRPSKFCHLSILCMCCCHNRITVSDGQAKVVYQHSPTIFNLKNMCVINNILQLNPSNWHTVGDDLCTKHTYNTQQRYWLHTSQSTAVKLVTKSVKISDLVTPIQPDFHYSAQCGSRQLACFMWHYKRRNNFWLSMYFRQRQFGSGVTYWPRSAQHSCSTFWYLYG